VKPTIALIGPGRVGCAISKRLNEAGYPIVAVISRNIDRAADACEFIGCSTDIGSNCMDAAITAEIILLAVPDDHIQECAQELQKKISTKTIPTLIHFSGLHPASIMRVQGIDTELLSLHPLLPFADRDKGYASLQNGHYAVEAEILTVQRLGEELVSALGGTSFTISADKKGLYHSAASIASNYLVTLLATAQELLIECGIPSEQAVQLLTPLMQSSLNNAKELGPDQGLTGPIIRGDMKTIKTHLECLNNEAPELLDSYKALAIQTTTLAEKSQRLTHKQALQLRSLLSQNSDQN